MIFPLSWASRFAFGLLQVSDLCSSQAIIWAGSGLLGGCSSLICKFLDAILLSVKVGTGTDAVFICGVPIPGAGEETRRFFVSESLPKI